MPSELINSLAIPGLPEWSGLVVALLLLLAAIAFLLMPFSVFGVKGRLESLEAQLDEIQDDIRALAMRLPELPSSRRLTPEEGWESPPSMRATAQRDIRPIRTTPPVPPPPEVPGAHGYRQEPRLR